MFAARTSLRSVGALASRILRVMSTDADALVFLLDKMLLNCMILFLLTKFNALSWLASRGTCTRRDQVEFSIEE